MSASAIPPATTELARTVCTRARKGTPGPVRAAALRVMLLNLGAGISGAGHDDVQLLLRHAQTYGGSGNAPVPGRRERLTADQAALVTAFAAGLDVVDAPGQATVRTGAAVLGAALPVVADGHTEPSHLLDALALGIEVQLSLAPAIRPPDDDRSWDVAGVVGPIGAAVTAGVLLRLNEERLRNAVAIASSTSLGHGQGVGTAVAAFHSGKAAANGLLAAFLAARGFTGAPAALEGARGWFRALGASADPAVLLDAFGSTASTAGSTWRLLDRRCPCDEALDEAVAARCERALPGRGQELVRTVRSLPSEPTCVSLLSAITPEES